MAAGLVAALVGGVICWQAWRDRGPLASVEWHRPRLELPAVFDRAPQLQWYAPPWREPADDVTPPLHFQRIEIELVPDRETTKATPSRTQRSEAPGYLVNPLAEVDPTLAEKQRRFRESHKSRVTQSVERGLGWLARRQWLDGSWSFDHRRPGEPSGDEQPGGDRSCTTGATALALATFFKFYRNPESQPYGPTIRKGLAYLRSRMQISPQGADLREGHDYAQVLAAWVLLEAYQQTQDDQWAGAAQQALWGLRDVHQRVAQRDPMSWYQPQSGIPLEPWLTQNRISANCTRFRRQGEVFAPLTELKRPLFELPPESVDMLDPVRADRRLQFVVRLWNCRDRGLIHRRMAEVEQWGPSHVDPLYNYFATWLMHEHGKSIWPFWERKLFYTIPEQESDGPQSGSWYWPSDLPATRAGGRHYITCMNLHTLSVYWRPLSFQETHAAFADDF